jgi:hypothetical protein
MPNDPGDDWTDFDALPPKLPEVTCEINASLPERGYLLERASTALPISKVRIRNPRSRKARIVLPDHYRAIRVSVLQQGQHDTLHYAKHRGVGADAEGEREHGDDGKGGRLTQHAQCEAQVLPKHLHGTLPEIRTFRTCNESGPDR